MGLVIGVSACVGCAYAVNKSRKKRKKAKLQQLSQDDDQNDQCSQSDDDEYAYDEGIDVTQAEVISETAHSDSVRKRTRGKSVESENSNHKAKSHKETTRRKKLQEETEAEVINDSKSGSLRSHRSNAGTPTSKSKKNYRHVKHNDSTSEDENETKTRKTKIDGTAVGETEDSAYESEDTPITRNMRLSIRVGDSGNTIFKIYRKNEGKQNAQELTSTTNEINV